MSAGLPGLGLGGLFFIISALLAPFGQLWRSLRGRGRAGEWRVVGRQFAQALTMVIAVDLTLRLTYVGLAAIGVGDVPSAVSGTVLPLTLIGITSVLLLLVLVLAKLAELRLRLAGGGRPLIPQVLPRPRPARALAYGGAAAIAWVALLAAGAAELSPLSQPPRDPAPAARPEVVAHPTPPAEPAGAQQPQLETTTIDRAAPDTAGDGAGQPQGQAPAAGGGAQPSSPEPSVSAPAPAAPASPGASPGGRPPQAASGSPQGAPGQSAASPPGPPVSAGPPEVSRAPENAGPKEGSSAPEHAGPPEGSSAPEQAGPGRP